ncbi:MAG: hypothetical protein ACREJY_08605 [Candidatus Rokuibacteriota bacterium]
MIIALLLTLTLPAAPAAAASERDDRLSVLAYLTVSVGNRLAVRCADRLPEYRQSFDTALAAWSSRHRDRIDRGRQPARAAAMDGTADLDADLDRRDRASAGEFARMREEDVRARCDAMLHELRIE